MELEWSKIALLPYFYNSFLRFWWIVELWIVFWPTITSFVLFSSLSRCTSLLSLLTSVLIDWLSSSLGDAAPFFEDFSVTGINSARFFYVDFTVLNSSNSIILLNVINIQGVIFLFKTTPPLITIFLYWHAKHEHFMFEANEKCNSFIICMLNLYINP